MSLCRNPELACEVTMQPLRRYALDAAILFSDILTVPDAMGLGLYFETGEGPSSSDPVQTADAIRKLRVPDVEKELGYVFDAVRTIRRELDGKVPLIGFAGSPWTVATYMVEGGSSSEFPTIKGLATEARSAGRAARQGRRHDDRIPECADRGGRPGGADFRYLGLRRWSRTNIVGSRWRACSRSSTA